MTRDEPIIAYDPGPVGEMDCSPMSLRDAPFGWTKAQIQWLECLKGNALVIWQRYDQLLRRYGG